MSADCGATFPQVDRVIRPDADDMARNAMMAEGWPPIRISTKTVETRIRLVRAKLVDMLGRW